MDLRRSHLDKRKCSYLRCCNTEHLLRKPCCWGTRRYLCTRRCHRPRSHLCTCIYSELANCNIPHSLRTCCEIVVIYIRRCPCSWSHLLRIRGCKYSKSYQEYLCILRRHRMVCTCIRCCQACRNPFHRIHRCNDIENQGKRRVYSVDPSWRDSHLCILVSLVIHRCLDNNEKCHHKALIIQTTAEHLLSCWLDSRRRRLPRSRSKLRYWDHLDRWRAALGTASNFAIVSSATTSKSGNGIINMNKRRKKYSTALTKIFKKKMTRLNR